MLSGLVLSIHGLPLVISKPPNNKVCVSILFYLIMNCVNIFPLHFCLFSLKDGNHVQATFTACYQISNLLILHSLEYP